jgi:hypothetical protein
MTGVAAGSSAALISVLSAGGRPESPGRPSAPDPSTQPLQPDVMIVMSAVGLNVSTVATFWVIQSMLLLTRA